MSPVWRPLSTNGLVPKLTTPASQQPTKTTTIPRNIPPVVNKSLQKHAEPNLSSSTEELLQLAATKYLSKAGSYESEEDTPTPVRRPIHVTPSWGKMTVKTAGQQPLPVALPTARPLDISISEITEPLHSLTLSDPVVPLSAIDPPSPPPFQKNVVCRYFAAGYCSRGERCNYLHTLGDGTTSATRVIPKAGTQFTNLKDYENEIFHLCLNQHGCRFLQKELDEGGPEETKMIFNGVIHHIIELMQDPFGNYLCQKLVEHCTAEQRLQIVKGVSSCVVQISKNMHGTRAIQRLIEQLQFSEEFKIIGDSLKGSVVALIQDLNGNHVIQKCLHKMEPNDNQFIYDAVAQHCVQVATHRHGCCVLQRCIDHGTVNQKTQLVDQIQANGAFLVQDPFGNYAVQYALDLQIPGLAFSIIEQIKGKLYHLSKQKFSSNVVEKCLKSGDPKCVLSVMHELLLNDEGTILDTAQTQLLDLLQDSYGNYVVQTCLSEGAIHAPREYVLMVALIAPYFHQLRNTPHSKRIYYLLNLLPSADFR